MPNLSKPRQRGQKHLPRGISSFLLLYLILLSNTALAQDTTKTNWREFYPLHVNDFWKYEESWMMGIPVVESKKVIGYEIGQNSKEYAKIQCIDYTFNRTGYEYQRVDNSGNVFGYYLITNYEYLLYKLDVCIGDTWPSQGTGYWRVDEIFISTDSITYLKFELYNSASNATNWICEGLGLYGYSFEGGSGSLTGAYINGKIWGDTTITGVDDGIREIIPNETQLEQNYPNPFNGSTQIGYIISRDCNIILNMFNINGERIRQLVNQKQKAGRYMVQWDGRGETGEYAPSGVYLCQLITGSQRQIRRILLLK